MAFLARCPKCERFQVCIFDLDSKINLKCRECGTVFPSVADDPIESEGINWALAVTLRDYVYEPPRPANVNLVIVQDLPSVYPRRKYRRRSKRRRVRVPVAPGEFTPTPQPEPIPPEPEVPAVVPEQAPIPTEEAAGDVTAPQAEEPPAPVAPPPILSVMPRPSPAPPARRAPRPVRKPRVEDDDVEYGRLQLNATAILALFLLVAGLVSASIARFGVAFWPLVGLSLAVGVLAIWSAVRQGRRLLIPLTTVGIATVAILISLVAPGLLGPGSARRKPPAWANEIMVIPQPQFAFDPDVRKAEWVDASKASILQGDKRVEIADVRIGKAPEIGSDSYLLIRVRVYRNAVLSGAQGSATSWNDKAPAVLHDASGNPSAQLGIVREPSTGNSPSASGQSGLDAFDTTLVFPAPGSADGLRLELPAAAWGGSATLKFALPRAMIKR